MIIAVKIYLFYGELSSIGGGGESGAFSCNASCARSHENRQFISITGGWIISGRGFSPPTPPQQGELPAKRTSRVINYESPE